MDIALIYLLLIAIGVLMYVLLDGFSLGVGILSPWLNKAEDRAIAMKSLSHLWDSNQTWLVFGGVVLFAGFPKAYATVLSQLYLPIILMLIALIFRGVAFEFYFKSHTSRGWWDFSFSFGSTLATLSQGIILGSLVQGFTLTPHASEQIAWFTPFSLMTAIALVCGYALLGSCWLVRKTSGRLQVSARRLGIISLFAVMFFLALVSVWMLLAQPQVFQRWLTWPTGLLLAPVPLLSAYAGLRLWQTLRSGEGNDLKPLGLAMALFGLSFIGLAAGMFPYIIPGQLTIWEAIAPERSTTFTLVGIVLFLPVIIAYNIYNYRVFSGKTTTQDGY
ncbi:cytochrome d ubiquinol oxidase subunit II [Hahella sp. CR1]|uniref:cytochrome d ubiquinol oxidase subunit II n=1 Tax=Hahella sp. CR1 TaxID=2992807 RepID=UPI0024415E5E|nr:cytochrome d ubiquinol oxidase subunit II [Hahella sp. CR1]MDG9668851.1 cytochrome d ubiquinol oxidase subunit II [Hahella sp. CR1]